MRTMLLTSEIDDRFGVGKIQSRIGLEADANIFGKDDDLFQLTKLENGKTGIDCVLVDEAQFLSEKQVFQLTEVVDCLKIPVLAFGLRTDFLGNLFEGSKALLAWADELRELKTICHCGKKATMVTRMDENNNPVREGAQVEIGGNDKYISLCRKHFKEQVIYPLENAD